MHPDADALFDLPPEEFVAARDALARRLRAAGDRAAATQVAGLRRPTVAAWAVNRVARDEPALLDAVADAGADLRHAQRRALSGIRDAGMAEAARARRAAVDAAIAAALALAGSQTHAAEIAATFEAAAAAADVADEVAAGRLTRPLPPPDAFGEIAGLTLVPAPDAGASAPEDPEDTGSEDEEAAAARRAAEQEVVRAGTAHTAAVEAAQRAAVQHDERRATATQAAAEVERLAAELERLSAALDAARTAAAAAAAAADEAADLAADADLAVRKRLRELEAAEAARAALDAG